MALHESNDPQVERRAQLARALVLVLPSFGRWASQIRDFETPYGHAGQRQLEALYMLRHELLEPNTPAATALADYFQIQRSVVTRVLAKLEQAGYIRRTADPRDARAQRIVVTEQGRQLSDFVEQEYFKEMQAALGELPSDDLVCLERAVTLLEGVAQELGMGALPNSGASHPTT
jgi:DNA-binding MarR family transcriptional regulator